MPLHPVARKMLKDAESSGVPNAHLLAVPVARDNFEAMFAGLEKPAIERVEDLDVPVRDALITARLYAPAKTDEKLPVVVYFHGGGWLLGSVDSHDVATRLLTIASGCVVLSVGYRRGPENRFPTAVNDAVDVIRWVHSQSNELGVNPLRLAVSGDSAGGNLATVAARVIRDEGGPRIAMQLLIYPVTTCDLASGFDMNFEGVMLYRNELQWHQDNYLRSPHDATDPRVAPLSSELVDLPPAAVVLAECDPIHPQGKMYVSALRKAGVPVEVYNAATLVHGFFGLDEIFPEASEAMAFAGKQLSRLRHLNQDSSEDRP